MVEKNMNKFVTDLLNSHIDKESGVLNIESFTEEFDKEAPKYIVPKAVFNEKNEELKLVRTQLDSNDTDGLQKQIDEYKDKLKKVEEERAGEKKTAALRSVLKDSHDPDFTASLLLNDVEIDEETGDYTNLEDVVGKLKESKPFLFNIEVKEDEGNKEDGTELNKVGKLANPNATPLTKRDIMGIRDKPKRLEAIKENPHLFKS